MIRRLSLATCLAILAGLPIPMWTATRDLMKAPSVPMMARTVVAIAWIFSAILPLFYFALWRNEGAVGSSRRARPLVPVGVVCGIALLATDFPIRMLSTLLSALGTLACVALLIALFFDPGNTAASRFLRSMTSIAIIGGALWFAINLLSLASNPTAGPVRTLLQQVCLFTPPAAIFLSRKPD